MGLRELSPIARLEPFAFGSAGCILVPDKPRVCGRAVSFGVNPVRVERDALPEYPNPRRGQFAKMVLARFAPLRNAKRNSSANLRRACFTPLATKRSVWGCNNVIVRSGRRKEVNSPHAIAALVQIGT